MRAGNAKPVTVPSERLTTSPMLVTGSGLWSLCHTKFAIVPSQDRVRIVASALDKSSAIGMRLNILVFIGAIRESRIAYPILEARVADRLGQRQALGIGAQGPKALPTKTDQVERKDHKA